LCTEDEEYYGKPTEVTIPENVNAIHGMIMGVQRKS
jgi:hypothetical protein